MLDYKELYLKMFRATEDAANILIAAQRECEEIFMSQAESTLNVVPLPDSDMASVEEM